MFIDDVKVNVKAGNGGAGKVAFRREKYVPKGGPSGGNGGDGGSVIFVGDEGLTTLIDLHYRKLIKAEDGENGQIKNCFGKNGANIYIRVPLGTVIYDLSDNSIIADITLHNQEAIIAAGGKGGRGNSAFATARITAPDYAEGGEVGISKEIRLELKVLADVGLVGMPSVGKSTLISVISAARPKIADYHFTTLYPNLGVVRVKDGRSFIVADLPGLIAGASSGAGLGIRFLRHIERTRVIVHVLDISGSEGRNPYEDYITINNELENYNPNLLERPQIIAANKMDLPSSKENLALLKKQLPDTTIIPISAYTKDNLNELLYNISDVLQTIDLERFTSVEKQTVVEYKFIPEPDPFVIEKDSDGVYNVVGPVIEKYFKGTDFNRDINVKIFARRLRNLGVEEALRKLGVKSGDAVRILGYEFELHD